MKYLPYNLKSLTLNLVDNKLGTNFDNLKCLANDILKHLPNKL